MKRGIILTLAGTASICACLAFGNKSKPVPVSSKGFAVIELFSSEGCSSCPPAEALMHKLIQKANAQSLPVYVIEFHVDYWDYLGWKDTFAMPEYSQRQQNYRDFLKLNSIYTPQAIINGKTEMVGSDADQINSAIATELQTGSSVRIDCKTHKTGNSKIEIEYNISGNIAGCTLNFAVVESNLTTYVKKGENSHKTLTHENVARVFKSIKLNSESGKIEIDAPHVNLSESKLICFLQNAENMNITGVMQCALK